MKLSKSEEKHIELALEELAKAKERCIARAEDAGVDLHAVLVDALNPSVRGAVNSNRIIKTFTRPADTRDLRHTYDIAIAAIALASAFREEGEHKNLAMLPVVDNLYSVSVQLMDDLTTMAGVSEYEYEDTYDFEKNPIVKSFKDLTSRFKKERKMALVMGCITLVTVGLIIGAGYLFL